MPSDDRRLQTWSRAHAALMLGGGLAAAAGRAAWPVAALAAASFALLFWLGRGGYTPSGRFGAANGVTTLRLAVTLALACVPRGAPGWWLAAAILAGCALDGLDGALARRAGDASPFGAQLDMDVDALMVLIANLQLCARGRLGIWILAGGLLRYVYVLAIAVAPAPAGHVPRSRLGRYALFALIVGLTAALVRDDIAGTALAAIGTAAVVTSFARSFRWSYRRSGPGR
jgi:phosphatidylglycerophosphate synthase